MTGSNEAAVTPKELSVRYIRHPHYIAKWRTSALRVNDDVKDAAGWKTHGAKRNVSLAGATPRLERRKEVKKKLCLRLPLSFSSARRPSEYELAIVEKIWRSQRVSLEEDP